VILEERCEAVVVTHEGPGLSRPRPESVAVGVEEEFHTVDLRTRRLTARADSLVEQLPASSFGSELQRSVLETNSGGSPRSLCGHHYRMPRQVLAAAGATVDDLPCISDAALQRS
jgi:hypothetical protein